MELLSILKVKEREKLSLPLDLMLLVSVKETQGHGRLMKRDLFSQIYGHGGAAIDAYKQRMGIEEMFP